MQENLNTANPWLARENGFFGSITVLRDRQKSASCCLSRRAATGRSLPAPLFECIGQSGCKRWSAPNQFFGNRPVRPTGYAVDGPPGDDPRAYCLRNYEIFSPFRGSEIIDFFVATAENSSMVLDSNHVMFKLLLETDQHGGA
jgi:hypothetical protein